MGTFWQSLANKSQKAMRGNSAFEELSKLPLDEARNVPVLRPFTGKKRFQIFSNNLVEHRLLGLARTTGFFTMNFIRTLQDGCRLFHGIRHPQSACLLRSPDKAAL